MVSSFARDWIGKGISAPALTVQAAADPPRLPAVYLLQSGATTRAASVGHP